MNLNEIRDEIDEIDTKIVDLICRRFDAVKKVAEYKRENNIKVLNKGRENDVIKKVSDKTDSYKFEVSKTYMALMNISKSTQYKYMDCDIPKKDDYDIEIITGKGNFSNIIFKIGLAYKIGNINIISDDANVYINVNVDANNREDLPSFLSALKDEVLSIEIK